MSPSPGLPEGHEVERASLTPEHHFSIELPPNARIDAMTFDDAQRALHVTLEGETQPRVVGADRLRALHGARIRHSIVKRAPSGIMSKATGKETVVHDEELHYALALRVDGIAELWYLLASSFNFRKALGPLATYSTELNFREMTKRLAAIAPHAVQDSFFTATTQGMQVPPPVDSLFEFFRIVSR